MRQVRAGLHGVGGDWQKVSLDWRPWCVTFLEDTKRFESTINLCFTMPATFLFTKFVSNKLNNYLRYTTVALFR